MIYTEDGSSICISTIPKYSCQDLFQRANFHADVQALIDDSKWNLIVLLGRNDLLIYPNDNEMSKSIGKELNRQVNLQISNWKSEEKCDFYERKSKVVTRKQILPAIKQAVK